MAAGNCFFKALFDIETKTKNNKRTKYKIHFFFLRSIETEKVKYFVFIQL